MPAQEVCEDPSEQDADRASAGGDEPEDTHRLRAIALLGEEGHDQRERDCGDDRAAEALHRTGAHEKPLRGREAAGERGEREKRDSSEEEAPVAVEVAEAPAKEEEAAEREEVGVRDPGERGLSEAEILADRRERDVHDRRVEDDHEVAEAEYEESDPAPAVVVGHSVSYIESEPFGGCKRPVV